MSNSINRCLTLLLAIVLLLTNTGLVEAARGTPGSPEFGFGVTVYPDGPYLDGSLAMLPELGIDWLNVQVDWAKIQPDLAGTPRLDTVDRVMQNAAENNIAVMLSLTQAPAWARTAQGPDAARTAQLVSALVQRYPVALQAVELFPGANTRQGWGGNPDPNAYLGLFQLVKDTLRASSTVVLVAGGLRSLSIPPPAGDMDDLIFLQGLYLQGASALMPVISLQNAVLTGTPLTLPTSAEQRVLRHYEDVRRVMVENRHTIGLIWITQISLPSGTINTQDYIYQDLNSQSVWMGQANLQMRSQLYLGVAFVQSLNPEVEGTASAISSLVRSPGLVHPFYSVLRDMVIQNSSVVLSAKPGKVKDGNLEKKRP